MPDQRNLDLFICYEIQGARSLDDLDEFIAFGMTFSILNSQFSELHRQIDHVERRFLHRS
jgi:hypothetical protein